MTIQAGLCHIGARLRFSADGHKDGSDPFRRGRMAITLDGLCALTVSQPNRLSCQNKRTEGPAGMKNFALFFACEGKLFHSN